VGSDVVKFNGSIPDGSPHLEVKMYFLVLDSAFQLSVPHPSLPQTKHLNVSPGTETLNHRASTFLVLTFINTPKCFSFHLNTINIFKTES
jgi:hypothetical protein